MYKVIAYSHLRSSIHYLLQKLSTFAVCILLLLLQARRSLVPDNLRAGGYFRTKETVLSGAGEGCANPGLLKTGFPRAGWALNFLIDSSTGDTLPCASPMTLS